MLHTLLKMLGVFFLVLVVFPMAIIVLIFPIWGLILGILVALWSVALSFLAIFWTFWPIIGFCALIGFVFLLKKYI